MKNYNNWTWVFPALLTVCSAVYPHRFLFIAINNARTKSLKNKFGSPFIGQRSSLYIYILSKIRVYIQDNMFTLKSAAGNNQSNETFLLYSGGFVLNYYNTNAHAPKKIWPIYCFVFFNDHRKWTLMLRVVCLCVLLLFLSLQKLNNAIFQNPDE